MTPQTIFNEILKQIKVTSKQQPQQCDRMPLMIDNADTLKFKTEASRYLVHIGLFSLLFGNYYLLISKIRRTIP